jgi:hypothetical protein
MMISTGIGIGICISVSVGSTHSPSTPALVNVLVSGAGTAEANGPYTPRGDFGGKPYFNLVGSPDDTDNSCIRWDPLATAWSIFLSDSTEAYTAREDVDNPWEVSEWSEVGGESPAPTVTQV